MILALDCSTSVGSVALVQSDETICESFIETPRGRGGALFSTLEKTLRQAPEIHRVVVGLGPGSYNGIRSALAVGWGIARARGVPLIGICSLLGLGEGAYDATGDARRGHFYYARVRAGRLVEQPLLLDRAGLLAAVEPGMPVFVPAPLDFLPQAITQSPSAARLCRFAATFEPHTEIPEPLYLKPAHITTPVGVVRK